MNPFGPWILNVITFLPLAGAVAILALPRDRKDLVARFATAVAGLDLLVSLPLWLAWNDAPRDAWGFRWVFEADWIPSLGVRYVVGVDGISMLLILLTTLLGFGSLVFASHRGLASLARLLTLGVGLSLLFSLLVLPVALRAVPARWLGLAPGGSEP